MKQDEPWLLLCADKAANTGEKNIQPATTVPKKQAQTCKQLWSYNITEEHSAVCLSCRLTTGNRKYKKHRLPKLDNIRPLAHKYSKRTQHEAGIHSAKDWFILNTGSYFVTVTFNCKCIPLQTYILLYMNYKPQHRRGSSSCGVFISNCFSIRALKHIEFSGSLLSLLTCNSCSKSCCAAGQESITQRV